MIRKRTTKEVRRYDIFKLSIVLLLLVLVFLMLLRDNDPSSLVTTDDEAASSETAESTSGDTADADGTAGEAYPADDDTADQEDAASETAAEDAYPSDEDTADQEDSDSEASEEGAVPSDEDAPDNEDSDPETSEEGSAPTDEDTTDQEDSADEVSEPELHTPAQDAVLEAGSNLFSGSGEPGSTVRVLADGTELGQTTVDENGNWVIEAELEAGEPIIIVETIDADGNVVAAAPPLAIMVNAADAEVTDTDLAPDNGQFFAGTAALGGIGEPGYQVVLFVDGEEVGTVEVGEDGTWTYPLDVEAGNYSISLQTVDENGDVVNEAGPFEVAVQDEIAPTVDLPEDDVHTGGMTLSGSGQPGTQVQLYANGLVIAEATVNEDGTYTVELSLATGRYDIDVATLDQDGNARQIIPALSLPVLALASPDFSLSDGELPEFDPLSGLVALRGTADPEVQLALQVNGETYEVTTTDEIGNWALPSDLAAGTYEISLAQLDADGNVVAVSRTITVELGEKSPILDLPDYSIADGGDSENIAERSIRLPAGDFEWTGQGEPGDTVAVVVDDELIGTTTADAEGNWSIMSALEAGVHEIRTGTVDEDGTTSNQSAAIDAKVADMPLPAMETPQLDDSGKGTINGTAAPDSVITVTADGKVAGITTSDESGSWTLNVDLGTGTFEIQAQVLDEEGEVVLTSARQTVTVGVSAESGENNDVIDVTAAQGEFSTLLTGLEAAGLTSRLSELDEAFTLFAPTDDAFDALPDEIVMAWNENPEAYKEIVYYLVLEGQNTQIELAEKEVLTTLAGTNIGITTDDESVLINDVPIEESLAAGNGIIHAIDQVILPPLGYRAQPPIIDISGVSIFTGDYLTVVGTAEPGTTILLQVSGENFGELAPVDDDGLWLASDDITSGVHEIIAYMLDEYGLLVAVSQPISLPVQ